MKNLINLYRSRPMMTISCATLAAATCAAASIFVSPGLGLLLVVAACVLLDDCGEVAE